MSAARILGSAYPVLLLVALLVVAIVVGVLAVQKGREEQSPYTRGSGGLAWWAALPTETQEETDNAALNAGEQAEADARQDTAEAAEFLARQVQINAQFHP